MSTTTFSCRDLIHRASDATKAADKGSVFITDNGRPAYVLLTIDEYTALTAPQENIAALLAMPDAADFELPIPPRRDTRKAAERD